MARDHEAKAARQEIHAANWQHFLARLAGAAAEDDPGPDSWLDPSPMP